MKYKEKILHILNFVVNSDLISLNEKGQEYCLYCMQTGNELGYIEHDIKCIINMAKELQTKLSNEI